MTRRGLFVALGAIAGVVVLTSGCAAWRISEAKDLAQQSQPYDQRPQRAALRLLVVGDSTGVGTGASAPKSSVAGRLGAAYPRLLIENRAANGARFEQVLQQLQRDSQRFDVVLIQAGGNDVMRLTSPDELRGVVAGVMRQAREVGQTVIVMPSGNVGNAPFFFWPLTALMTQRSRTLHEIVRESAAATPDLVYVDLYAQADLDPFVQQPGMHSRDGLHPSDRGYAEWTRQLQQQAELPRRLAAAR